MFKSIVEVINLNEEVLVGVVHKSKVKVAHDHQNLKGLENHGNLKEVVDHHLQDLTVDHHQKKKND
jgi:hypothetical protein